MDIWTCTPFPINVLATLLSSITIFCTIIYIINSDTNAWFPIPKCTNCAFNACYRNNCSITALCFYMYNNVTYKSWLHKWWFNLICKRYFYHMRFKAEFKMHFIHKLELFFIGSVIICGMVDGRTEIISTMLFFSNCQSSNVLPDIRLSLTNYPINCHAFITCTKTHIKFFINLIGF